MATEIVFVVEEDPEGGFVAHALGEGIYTQADDMAALHIRYLREDRALPVLRLRRAA